MTVWIFTIVALGIPFGFSWLLLPIVAPLVLAYLAVVGLPVYFAMKHWGKCSIIGYTVAALVAGVPISSLWVVQEEWIGATYYLAVAGVCGPIGYWIVERT